MFPLKFKVKKPSKQLQRATGRKTLRMESLEQRTLMAVIPLSSNPGADHTLYLDFDGHPASEQETVYLNCTQNGQLLEKVIAPTIVEESVTDPTAIFEIWAQIADDFAPFNINVTTVEPESLKPGGDSTGKALRVAIGTISSNSNGGSSDNSWFETLADGSCSPLTPQYLHPEMPNTVFVDSTGTRLGSNRELADVASHEAAHAFALNHHITPADEINLSPIMEMPAPSSNARQTLWHKGMDDVGQWQDDFVELTSILGPRTYGNGATDDHGNNTATARGLTQVNYNGPNVGNRLTRKGVIETTEDRDAFSFRVESDGPVSIRVLVGVGVDVTDPIPVSGPGPNLNATLELWSAHSTEPLAVIDQWRLDVIHTFQVVPRNHVELFPGDDPLLRVGDEYFLVVRGTGGYTQDYNLGSYTVVVEGAVAGQFTPPPDFGDVPDYIDTVPPEAEPASGGSFPTGPFTWPPSDDEDPKKTPDDEAPKSTDNAEDNPPKTKDEFYTRLGEDQDRSPDLGASLSAYQLQPVLPSQGLLSQTALNSLAVDAVFSRY